MSRKSPRPAPAAAPEKPPAIRRPLPWDAIAAAVALLLMAWMVTEGTWSLYGTTGLLESFYEAQAQSFLAGRVDVDPDAIQYEAFMRDGKAYGYFGPTPALLRLPLVVLFPSMRGHWSRGFMLGACLLMLGALWLLLRNLETHLPELRASRLWTFLRPILILAAAIGSTNYFILEETKVYQESIMWAATFSLAHVSCLAWYLTGRRGRWLALACVTAFLAFFARVSSGVGPLFALALVDAAMILPVPRLRAYFGVEDAPSRGRAVAAISGTLLASAVLWACLNYWKFGVWFVSQPIAKNLEYTPERLANVKGELASFSNIPMTLFVYLAPTHVEFSSWFPFVHGVLLKRESLAAQFPGAHLDSAQAVVALPVSVPEWFLAALAGTALILGSRGGRLRALRAPIWGALAGCGLVFCWGFLTHRYLHDLFPWLIAAGAPAVALGVAAGPPRLRRPVAAGFALLTLYAMWANFGLALVQQRWYGSPISTERRLAMTDLSASSKEGGISGLISYWRRWRLYIPAVTAQARGLAADQKFIPDRRDQPVVHSEGPPPYAARYVVETPADGQYELAIRYASAEPRPVLLSIDGRAVGYACTKATGGSSATHLTWVFAGNHALRRGPVLIDLTSKTPFPTVQALRLVRLD